MFVFLKIMNKTQNNSNNVFPGELCGNIQEERNLFDVRFSLEKKNVFKEQDMPTKSLDADLKNEFIGKNKHLKTWLKNPGKKYGVDLKGILADQTLDQMNKTLRQISDLKLMGLKPKDFISELMKEKITPFLNELQTKAPILAKTFQASREERSAKRGKFGDLLTSVIRRQGKPFLSHSSFSGKRLDKTKFGSQAVWHQYRARSVKDVRYNYDPSDIPPDTLHNVTTLMVNELWSRSFFDSFKLQMIRRMRKRLSEGPYKLFAKAELQMRRQEGGDKDVNEDGETSYARQLMRQSTSTARDTQKAVIYDQWIVLTKTDQYKSLPVVTDMDVVNAVSSMSNAMQEETKAFGEKYLSAEVLQGKYLQLEFSAFKPLAGASYIELPKYIKSKKCIVNVQNKDTRCFEYAVLSAMYSDEVQKDAERPTKYTQWLGTYDFSGVEFPVKVNGAIKKFETNNGIAISVYGFLDESKDITSENFRAQLIPLYITDFTGDSINLLFYKGHYSWIKNWQRFTNENGRHLHHCQRCLCSFKTIENLSKHMETCVRHSPMQVTMPKPNSELRFDAWHKTVRHPIVIYGDFEALSTSITNGPKDCHTTQTAASFGLYVVSDYSLSIPNYHSYVGPAVYEKFIETLRMIESVVRTEVFTDKDMLSLTEEEQNEFNNCTHCPHCEVEFGSQRWSSKTEQFQPVIKCKDHSHQTGQYRMPLCEKCNLRLGIKEQQGNRFIPVFFHNLKGYDMTHVLAALAQDDLTQEKLNVIPQNGVKFTTFSWTPKADKALQIRFLDSLAFLTSSLDTLIGNLPDEDKVRMRQLAESPKEPQTVRIRFGGRMIVSMEDAPTEAELFELVKRKGNFPYEWFDSLDKLNATSLPSVGEWDSLLARSYITGKQLAQYEEEWNSFGFTTFKDWHDHYLKKDVFGLADVFEAFRRMSLSKDYVSLDPVNYMTLPGMGNDAAYKYTKAEVEITSDIDIYNLFESGIRGGLSEQSHRYSLANNKYMGDDHDPNQPSTYNMYLDANNLYGWAMKQSLPYQSIAWLNAAEITENDIINLENEKIQESLKHQVNESRYGDQTLEVDGKHKGKTFSEISKDIRFCHSLLEKCANSYKYKHLIRYLKVKMGLTTSRQPIGLTLKVDLEYPKELHDLHNDYPLAPESMHITEQMISDYSKQALDGKKFTSYRKLVATLYDKKDYVIHSRNLKFYLEKGMKLTKIHAVIGYIEKAWLKPYIELNEGRRAKAKNDFEKDFFKLMNNAVFGKQMENVRNRFKPLKFITSEQQFLKETSKPSYLGDCTKYSESMMSLTHMKTDVTLNKPIQNGFAILDLSKLCMYQFHYDVMLPKYGSDNLKKLFTDTDSLCYRITTEDVYEDMATGSWNSEFDFSGYDKAHPLYSTVNKKIAGKFKDEKDGIALVEFVGLRSKMYVTRDQATGQSPKQVQKLFVDEQGVKRRKVQEIDPTIKITGKGIKKSIAKTELTLQHFKDTLFGISEAPKVRIPSLIQSNKNGVPQVFMQDRAKKSLSRYDDKRFILPDGIETRAHGHYNNY